MLRALSGPLAGATFEVGPRVLIGRAAACDVHVVDVEVSREHAMIVSHDGVPTLVDLDSRNGTVMDGKRVRRVPLEAGDAFSVAGSKFIYDRAAPISTTPVLSAHFSVDVSEPASQSDALDGRPTREVVSAKTTKVPAVSLEERETQRAIAAATDDDPEPEPEAKESAPDLGGRPTVQLEAAKPPEDAKSQASNLTQPAPPKERPADSSKASDPISGDKATVQLRAMETVVEPDAAPSAVETAALEAAVPPSKTDFSDARPSFAPPPVPTGRPVETRAHGKKRESAGAYPGDLLADITAYRSFRLQLQLARGDMPSGEEVASMIDLEAVLREPPQTDLRRDVVTQRFFRRFPFVTSLQARFTSGGTLIAGTGKTTNLSADGIQCSLDLDGFSPKPDQLAMLVIEHQREGVDVRYSVTARVVWSKNRVSGFVFAGVPSWSERGDEFDDVETAIRARPSAL